VHGRHEKWHACYAEVHDSRKLQGRLNPPSTSSLTSNATLDETRVHFPHLRSNHPLVSHSCDFAPNSINSSPRSAAAAAAKTQAPAHYDRMSRISDEEDMLDTQPLTEQPLRERRSRHVVTTERGNKENTIVWLSLEFFLSARLCVVDCLPRSNILRHCFTAFNVRFM